MQGLTEAQSKGDGQRDARPLLPDVEDGRHDTLAMGVKDEEDVQFEEPDSERHSWGRKTEYVLSMVGYCVGIGNVWRFPYVCIRNGGGAFLIPFFLCLTLCGMPLYFLEVSMGQFVSQSAYHVWSICPLFRGLGISMNMISFMVTWYYSMILGWTLIFFFHSFRDPLPWTRCDGWWNTANCQLSSGGNVSSAMSANVSYTDDLLKNSSNPILSVFGNSSVEVFLKNATNTTVAAVRTSASEEFWTNNVLQLSPGLSNMDGVPLQSGIALTVSSIVVCLCIIKGVNSVGKVVYVTATLPYILLTILMIKGFTLDGAMDGVLFYIKPDFSKLMHIQTWTEASIQVFYSLGPGWGGLITMASYNKFNNNCMKDAITLAFACEGTSVFAAFAIFTVLGHMAHTLDVPVANFSDVGPGLAFVVYPEAISYLPVPQLWGVLFFLMLFTLGLDTQFVMLETIFTTMNDVWPTLKGKRETACKVVLLFGLLLISLPFAARGGMYLFYLVDWYIAAFTVFVNGICELIIVTWIYGADRFLQDIRLMIGRKPPYIFTIFWKFVNPTMLTMCMVTTLMTYAAPIYKGYHYDAVGISMGWCVACASFIPVPIFIIYRLVKSEGTLMQRLKESCRPTPKWKPAHTAPAEVREQYKLDRKQWDIFPDFQRCCVAEVN